MYFKKVEAFDMGMTRGYPWKKGWAANKYYKPA